MDAAANLPGLVAGFPTAHLRSDGGVGGVRGTLGAPAGIVSGEYILVPVEQSWLLAAVGDAGEGNKAMQPEDSRCPPTYRREEAVKALIGMGWKWDGNRWSATATLRQQAGRVDVEPIGLSAECYISEKHLRMLRDPEVGICVIERAKSDRATIPLFTLEQITATLAQQCAGCGEAIRPDPMTGTTCACATAERARMPDVDAMVSRFLGWTLPKDFAPDAGISFKPIPNPQGDPYPWPTGTNLLHAGQAKAMFEYVIAAAPSQRAEDKEAAA